MEIIAKISRDLNEFDIILMLFCGRENGKRWAEQIMKSKELRYSARKILILSEMDLPCADASCVNVSYTNASCTDNSCTCRRIDGDEIQELKRLYRMYEFSDKLVMISDRPQYGDLLNYVKTGVMTMGEAVQALLYKG